MKLKTLQPIAVGLAVNLVLNLGLNLGLAAAASPVIGTVLANGGFRLDGSTVMGNGTLFEGSVVETHLTGTSIQLSSGARLSLGAASRGKLYGDHILLEKGESRLENGTGFHLMALGLRIQPERGSSTGRIALDGNARVRVTALTGSFRVLNARGVLVANLAPGAALVFEPRLTDPNATRITGTLSNRDGHLLVTDEVTKVNVEVTGADLYAKVGSRLEITGSMDPTATPVSGASHVVRARQFQTPPAGGTAPAGAGGGAAASGVSITLVVAVVAGVAAAAVLGGLAAAEALPGQGDPSVSR